MTSARRRSKASAPSPSQIGRYAAWKGTTASSQRIGAKPSMIAAAMCTDEEGHYEQRRVLVHRGHDEARPAVRLPALHLHDPERGGDRQQHDRHHTRAAGEVPERFGAHCGEHIGSSLLGRPRADVDDLAAALAPAGPAARGDRASPVQPDRAPLRRCSRCWPRGRIAPATVTVRHHAEHRSAGVRVEKVMNGDVASLPTAVRRCPRWPGHRRAG